MDLITAKNRLAATQIALREAEKLVASLTPHTVVSTPSVHEDPTEIIFEGEALQVAKFSGTTLELDAVKASLTDPGTIVFCDGDNCIARRTDVLVSESTHWKDWWEIYGKADENKIIGWHSLAIPE